MTIALAHKHFDADHLETVKAEMQALGAPSIRAFWSDLYGVWLAVEGCHRIRAAHALGLEPVIVAVTTDGEIDVEVDGDVVTVDAAYLFEELQDAAHQSELIRF